ncbi:glycosyltransferase family 2 protein [Rhodoferax sp.]|uniref:glycosyltransferase family 2 protein n=1 Tax=Rhodoferax sp. TaxID=50421 RepID=UPI00285218CD|nr:glycosyltransferase family 2 protein [Rhodoferax sp.]MDR3371565.1 glycosyltransferase family 2 protein [Rhodoferax sp.]
MSVDELAAVSVIIPCFRCTKTIARALTSVAVQTLRPVEVILVEDASGDDTRALLHELQAQHESGWVKLVLLDQNVGAGSARNVGWGAATQPYIAFLDSDDAWHPQKIEVQLGYMVAHPDVVLSGHASRVLQPGSSPKWLINQLRPAKTVQKWPMILKNPFVTPSVMLRRDIQQQFLERQRYMEDHMLWMRVVCSGERVVKIPITLAAIYKNPFGVAGLSSNIWKMERGDLGNYRRLYQAGCVNSVQFSLLVVYSALKYVRRLIIYTVYLVRKKDGVK